MILKAALLAGAVAVVVGAVGAFVVLRVARRSLAAAAVVAPLVVVTGVAAGFVATARAMFINEQDSAVVIVVTVISLPIAVFFGWLIAQRVQALTRRSEQEAAEHERDRRVEEQRRELVAWMSHDLRTPLAGIRAMAEAIEDGYVPAGSDYPARIRAEADRMGDMLASLLALARLQSGTLALDRTDVDLADIVSDAVASTKVLAGRSGVSVTGSAVGSVTADVDPRELSRALSNLLTNAVTHTCEGGEIDVSLTAAADEARIAVRDTCGGIPHDQLERVFEPGWRGSRGRTPERGAGAGLGLAIARGIARAHGGDVTVTNVGSGCRFDLVVPRST